MPDPAAARVRGALRVDACVALLLTAVSALAVVAIDAQSPRPRPSATPAPSWGLWGGPNRDFHAASVGLASSWPATGPKKLWSRPLGEGYSAIAVEGNRLYTMFRKDTREIVVAMDAANGDQVWTYAYQSPFTSDPGPGPFAMPQILGDRLITVGSTGKLHAIDKKTGKPVWSHDLYEEYGGSHMRFGYSCHALPYRDSIIMMVGGRQGSIMAFKQSDGSVRWAKHRYNNSHSSPLLINVDGQDQVVALMGQQVVGLEPTTGELLWEHAHPTQYDLAVSTPSWGKDNILVVSSSYEGGTRALRLAQKSGRTTVTELWHNPRIRVHIGTLIRVNDVIFGASGHDGPAPITAFDVKTGQALWNTGRDFAKAQLLWADHKLIILDQDGLLALATADRQGLKLLSKVELLQRIAWTPPTLVGTRLYVRDRNNVMALDLAS